VTTVLQPARPDGPSGGYRSGGEPGQPRLGGRPDAIKAWLAAHPAWPLSAMLIGWPLWWILGFSAVAPAIFMIPMLWIMYRWNAKRQRKLRFPPGFILWALFLLLSVISALALGQQAPETVVSSASNRLVSWGLRLALYIGCTVYLLFAGNLTEQELPRRKLAWMMGLVGIYTVAGGILGTLLPAVQLTSPLAYLVPQSIQQNQEVIALMLHPATSQVMNFLGYAEGRPSAPFSYTNMWGNSIAILLPWLLVAWYAYGNRRQRRATIVVFCIGLIPVVYSLDRGLWVGLGLSVIYLAVRFAARGKVGMIGVIAGTLAVAAAVILFSPLGSLIEQRLQHGRSNQGRTNYSLIAGRDALSSPFIGYGDTRHAAGSAASIAIGRTSSCRNCGYTTIGGNGQLQLMLICTGLLGAALYCGFFAYGFWRYRTDKSPYGMAGLQVLLVGFWFMFVYESVGPPLGFAMLAYALLWKNERVRRGIEPDLTAGEVAPPPSGPAGPAVPGHARRGITGATA
jgi:hypothetical protein